MRYRFGDLEIDLERHQVTRDATPVKLTPLGFRVLQTLVEAAPAMVTHDELITRAWGENRVVTPENLQQRIKLLRDALGDDPANPSYIELVRGEGYRLVPEVRHLPDVHTETTPPASDYDRSWRSGMGRWSVPILLSLCLLAWVAWTWRTTDSIPSGDETAAEDTLQKVPPINLLEGPSIAVLPFEDLSQDGSMKHLGEGIADEIIHSLVEQTNLPVVARSLSFQDQGEASSPQELGTTLRATHLLEGSILRRGDTLLVSARLIDAPSGMNLFSERSEIPDHRLHAVQSDLANRVVEKIQGQLEAQGELRLVPLTEPGTVATRGEASADAYDAYLLGLSHAQRWDAEHIERARSHFEEALNLSPGFYPARRALIEMHLARAHLLIRTAHPIEAFEAARSLATKGLANHPEAPYLDAVLAFVSAFVDLEWENGLLRLESIAEDTPNDAGILTLLGVLSFTLDRDAQADRVLERALLLRPDLALTAFDLAWTRFLMNRGHEGLALLKNVDSEYVSQFGLVALNYALGQYEALDQALRKLRPLRDKEDGVMRSAEVLWHAAQGDMVTADRLARDILEQIDQNPAPWFLYAAGGDGVARDAFRTALAFREPFFSYFFYRNRTHDWAQAGIALLQMSDVTAPQLSSVYRTASEVDALLESERPLAPEEEQRYLGAFYVGAFGTGKRALLIEQVNGRLHFYIPQVMSGHLVAQGDHRFVGLRYRGIDIECSPNEADAIDLCFWTHAGIRYHGYRQPLPPDFVP